MESRELEADEMIMILDCTGFCRGEEGVSRVE
jgi:hypothetical protein